MKKITFLLIAMLSIQIQAQITTATEVGFEGIGYYTSADYSTRGDWGTLGRVTTPTESTTGVFTWEFNNVPLGNNVYTGAGSPFLLRNSDYSVTGFADNSTIENEGDFENVVAEGETANFMSVVKGIYNITFTVDTTVEPHAKTVNFELIQDYYHNLSFGLRGFNLPLGDGNTITDWSGNQNMKTASRVGNVYSTKWEALEFPSNSGLWFVDVEDIVRNGLLNTMNYVESNLTLEGTSFDGAPTVTRNPANETFNFAPGTYDIEIKIDADYSQDGDFITLTINPTGNLSAGQDFTSTISLAPNPVVETLQVVSGVSVASIGVYAISGEKLLSANSVSSIDMSSLPSGVYIVKVLTDNGGILISKIIKA